MTIFQENLSAQELCEALGGKFKGTKGVALCPGHDDHNPSLSIENKNGKVLFKCFSGCSQESVLTALKERGLWPDTNRGELKSNGEFIKKSVSIYTDEIGGPVLEVTRLENGRGGKKFAQKYFDGSQWVPGGWKKSGKTITPYHFLSWKDSEELLFHVEGEACADFLRSQFGINATTSPGGANGW